MKLQETIPFHYNIVEGKKRKGVLMTVEGTFQRADTKNANGRVYPKTVWDKILADSDVNERIKSRRMFGELDHPASGASSLTRVSHVITEHKLLPDNRVLGQLDILNTPHGQIAAALFEAGCQVGVSSRGDGSVEQKGDVAEVQDDYRFETYDLVIKPSTQGAFPQIVESEEAAKANVELIAKAVEGLVKTKHDDIDVLLECHKIISVLEGCESRCESILSDLKVKLQQRGKEQQIEETSEENEMSVTREIPPTINLSPEVETFMREWVEKGISEAVEKKDTELNQLKDRIVQLTAEKERGDERLAAAESLIDEFQRKVQELSENASTDQVVQERLTAATALLDEAIPRLQEMGNLQRELNAAKDLLATSLQRFNEAVVSSYIASEVSDLQLSEEDQDKVLGLFEDCQTMQEARKKLESLSSLMESHTPPRETEPLPKRGQPLHEDVVDQRSRGTSGPTDLITARLIQRVGS